MDEFLWLMKKFYALCDKFPPGWAQTDPVGEQGGQEEDRKVRTPCKARLRVFRVLPLPGWSLAGAAVEQGGGGKTTRGDHV